LADKTNQTGEKTIVKTNTTDINTLRDACTQGLWYVYAGLLMILILTPTGVLAYFPMELIYKASKAITHDVFVPAKAKKKICIHLFKAGETFTLTNNLLVPILVGMALSATSTVLVWYSIAPGATVTDQNPTLLGDIAFKYIMTMNASLTTAGDITFTINEA